MVLITILGISIGYSSLNSEFSISGEATVKSIYAKSKILSDNGGKEYIESKGAPDFSQIATTDEGMYAAEDDFGMSYYFRGAVDNNWFYFADYYWRIIRINGDGSIRLIYNGKSIVPEDNGNINYGTQNNDNAYVGYMYGNINSDYINTHANVNNSLVKQMLDEWFVNNLYNYQSYLSDSGFCSDRSYTLGSAINTTQTTYGARDRLYENKKPSLKCKNLSNDLFTVDNVYGNQSLTYPIALITADELAYAGSVYNLENTDYYLYRKGCYWTMTPNHYTDASTVFRLCAGILNFSTTYGQQRQVIPVINLKAKTEIIGDGTENNPYKIVN